MFFHGSPDVNTEFSDIEFYSWIWHVEFRDVENIYVEFFNVEYLILILLTVKDKADLNSEAKNPDT